MSHTADLDLASRCAKGEPAATRELADLAAREVPRALRRLGQSPAFAEDISQQLLSRLLVEGKIRDYAGRGALGAWLRSAALRMALNALDGVKPQASVSRSLPAPSRGEGDPELGVLRRRYGRALKAAVEAALRGLPAEDRNVLRFYFVDGLTVEQIARIRGAHKSTVSRLITRVRKQLRDDVKDELARDGDARPEEVSSVLRAMVSDVDVSLERALELSADRK